MAARRTKKVVAARKTQCSTTLKNFSQKLIESY